MHFFLFVCLFLRGLFGVNVEKSSCSKLLELNIFHPIMGQFMTTDDIINKWGILSFFFILPERDSSLSPHGCGSLSCCEGSTHPVSAAHHFEAQLHSSSSLICNQASVRLPVFGSWKAVFSCPEYYHRKSTDLLDLRHSGRAHYLYY